jgi:Acetoacetate decarboxylase (ADC)
MVAFITRVDDPEIPPPYSFPGITLMSFRLPAALANLQALCDQLLNIGTLADRGFEYRAFTNFVDMEIVTYPKMLFAQAPYSHRGFASQQELYFRFFAWKFVSVSGVLIPEPLPDLCMPFMFVDNSWSMISGRNVIGFPKVMAQFSPTPVLNANPFQISVSALVLQNFSAMTMLDWQPVVKINPSAGPAPIPQGFWPWIGLGGEIADPFLNWLLQEMLANLPIAFSTVKLKQFRDASNSTDACYQAVVTTPFTPSNISVPTALPPVTITVEKYDSLDIPSSFGFPPGVPLQPALQCAVTLDMSMQNATNLFVST